MRKKINQAKGDTKPRKRVILQRLGFDGTPEAIVTVMDHAPVHSMYIKSALFKSIKNGCLNAGTQVDTYYTAQGGRVDCRFVAREALCIRDQSVLLALCQLGAQESQRTQIESNHPDWAEVASSLNPTGVGANLAVIALNVKASQIAKAIGLNDSGTNSRSIQESLRRLSNVVLHRKLSSGNTGQTNVIGCNQLDGNKRKVFLSAELAYRCVHHDGVSWVNMEDQRELASPPAKRLHAFLSAWASDKEARCIGLGKLAIHVYGPGDCSAGMQKSRRLAVRLAIAELATLPGWWCEILERADQLKVRKPIFAGTRTVAAAAQTSSAVALSKSAISHPTPLRKVSIDGASQRFSDPL